MVTKPQPWIPKKGRLTNKDHTLLDKFLAHVLDRYKGGAIDRASAIADIAHLVAAVDLPDGDDWAAYMRVKIRDDDA